MTLGRRASLAPPAVWLPAPLFCPRSACRHSPCHFASQQQLEATHRGCAAVISDSRGDRREPAVGQRSRASPAESLRAAASVACDAASAPHGRRLVARQASATAVCDRPSAQTEARASQLAQYPWAVDPKWTTSTAAETSRSAPRRPSGVGRRGVTVQGGPDRASAADARRSTAHRSVMALPQHVEAQPPGALGNVKALSDAERLAQTVRCVSSGALSRNIATSDSNCCCAVPRTVKQLPACYCASHVIALS